MEVQSPAVGYHSQSGVSLDQIKVIWIFFLFLKKKKKKKKNFQRISSRIDSISQDVTNVNNPSFPAPYAVAGRAEPTPAKVPHCPYSDERGSILGGPAAALASSVADSLTHVSFESLIDRVRELEQHFGYLPDKYLQSLRGQIIRSRDHSVLMSGDSIIDSIRSYRLRVCDPVSLTPGSPHNGDSIVPFLQSLFGIATFNSSF